MYASKLLIEIQSSGTLSSKILGTLSKHSAISAAPVLRQKTAIVKYSCLRHIVFVWEVSSVRRL